MFRYRGMAFFLLVLIAFAPLLLSNPQETLSVKEILEKNIQAAGAKERLAEVKSYSFKVGSTSLHISSNGEMKIVEGKTPIVTEVINVDANRVRRNCFNTITEFSGLQKSLYQSLAMLRSGLYTLEKFKDRLEYKGIKSYGPKKQHMLTSSVGDLQVDFYLDSEDFTLKRLVLKGHDPSRGKYEVSHDMGPYQEIGGIKIPFSWYSSQVGTRGRAFEISDVQINPALEDDFFSKLEINAGTVEASQGLLKGNVIDFEIRGRNLFIHTNWTEQCIQNAGFKTNDKVNFKVKEMEFELDFYKTGSELPPRSSFTNGARVMFLDERQGETYLIYFYAVSFLQLTEILEPLLPIQVIRK